MRARAAALAGPALGLLLAAALLVPEADRDTLVARSASAALADELGTGAAPLADALARALAGVPDPRLAVSVRVDGHPAPDPAYARAVAVALASRRGAGDALAGLRIAAEGEEAPVRLRLDVGTRDDRVALAARVETLGAAAVPVPARSAPRPLPGRTALLPPLLAIGIALAIRRTLLALFAGIWLGAALHAAAGGALGPFAAAARGLVDVFSVYLRREMVDTFRLEIIGFVVALFAMVAVVSRAGGVSGLVDLMLGYARSVRSSLILTWVMGLGVFFDDYANCMLVGSTMRPLTDRLRVSREKLAYVVDSTAAPVAGISLLSTWIAFEVSVYSAQLPGAGIALGGYALFLEALPYRFYCLLTIFFVGLVAATGRDFGPMARAERRARATGAVVRPGGRPPVAEGRADAAPAAHMPRDWRVGALPIATTLGVTAFEIFREGGGFHAAGDGSLYSLEGVTQVLFDGSGPRPIFAGAVAGLLLALALAGSNLLRLSVAAGAVGALALAPALGARLAGPLPPDLAAYASLLLLFATGAALVGFAASALLRRTARPHLHLRDLSRSAVGGVGTLGFAVVLLFEAWMIGRVCQDLATAEYLIALLGGGFPPAVLPVLLFGLACLVSFATGSSWSTMSILLPNVVALAATLGAETHLGALGMVVLAVAAVLDGSIFGDHCSPISDTTVLSSVATACDHVDHVRTQAPYALATAAAAALLGYAPAALLPGWGPASALATGAGALAVGLLVAGRPAPLAEDEIP